MTSVVDTLSSVSCVGFTQPLQQSPGGSGAAHGGGILEHYLFELIIRDS